MPTCLSPKHTTASEFMPSPPLLRCIRPVAALARRLRHFLARSPVATSALSACRRRGTRRPPSGALHLTSAGAAPPWWRHLSAPTPSAAARGQSPGCGRPSPRLPRWRCTCPQGRRVSAAVPLAPSQPCVSCGAHFVETDRFIGWVEWLWGVQVVSEHVLWDALVLCIVWLIALGTCSV